MTIAQLGELSFARKCWSGKRVWLRLLNHLEQLARLSRGAHANFIRAHLGVVIFRDESARLIHFRLVVNGLDFIDLIGGVDRVAHASQRASPVPGSLAVAGDARDIHPAASFFSFARRAVLEAWRLGV